MFRNKDIEPIRLDNKNSSGFIQKISNFIQYNNAFVLIVVFVLGISGVALGSENIREGVLLGKEEREIGVDNAILLATDIENWQFEPQILSIETDEEYYYVSYKLKSLAIQGNIWQELWRENLLKFEKNSDRYTNVEDYIVKEIGEVVAHEHQLLKDSKKAALKQGMTQKALVVEYNGLVGRVLNLERRVIPQENPLATEQTIQLAQQSLEENANQPVCNDCVAQAENVSQPTIDKELIRKIVEEILSEKSKSQNPKSKNEGDETIPTEDNPVESDPCTPNWQCSEWQPALDQNLCGQKIGQTRICSDVNDCGTGDGKPIEAQEVDGVTCEVKEEEQQ